MPLRIILTGEEYGPKVDQIYNLLEHNIIQNKVKYVSELIK